MGSLYSGHCRSSREDDAFAGYNSQISLDLSLKTAPIISARFLTVA
ncbi:Preprotein translocase subunit SecA [Pseudomonas syringae pv. actinidiae]|uniref:Preprotein translocase subunit SecA n=1 Tax=Pseudomonas syringae pv. actinidiae TaxID=103796 RepID=A0AAN4TPQ1_PSESF|nr:Preprotein translocase subunit SecA [Pseudomonas syringae pv. actinidiae]